MCVAHRFTAVLLFAICPIALGQNYRISEQPIFIKTEHSACINRNTDRVTMTLKGLRLEKEGGFWSEDKSLGLAISASPEAAGNVTALSVEDYPLLRQIDLSDAEVGFIQKTGTQRSLLNYFDLKNDEGVEFTRIGYGVKLIKTRGSGDGIEIASRIISSVESLSLPPNPYSAQAQQVAGILNGFIDGLENSENSNQRIFGSSVVNMSFDSDGIDCDNFDAVHTGFTVFIFAPNGSVPSALRPGIVDIDSHAWDRTCFKVDPISMRPQFYEKPTARRDCDNSSVEFKNLNNPYVLFYISRDQEVISEEAKILAATIAFDEMRLSQYERLLQPISTTQANNIPQVVISRTASERDETIATLNQQIAELSEISPDTRRAVDECLAYELPLIECLVGVTEWIFEEDSSTSIPSVTPNWLRR